MAANHLDGENPGLYDDGAHCAHLPPRLKPQVC